jgi:hypothetical protein
MLDSTFRSPSDSLHVCADVIVASVAAGLVLLVFFPITLCASGIKRLLRLPRPHAAETSVQLQGFTHRRPNESQGRRVRLS